MSREDLLRQLADIDWSGLRSNARVSSDYVPGAFRALIDAQTDAEADTAYWQLDNGIVTQGRLHEAAPKLVAPLLGALDLELSDPARHRVVELLTELALGVTANEEAALGSGDLARAARAAIGTGLPTIYRLLADDDPRVRRAALHILTTVELDTERLTRAIEPLANTDPDEQVRALVSEHRTRRDGGSPKS